MSIPEGIPKQVNGEFHTYEVSDEILGKGSYGIVMQGRKRSTGDAVAIKFSQLCPAGDAREHERLKNTAANEIEMLRKVATPRYIVQMWDSCSYADQFVIMVLEQALGTLRDRLRSNALSPALVHIVKGGHGVLVQLFLKILGSCAGVSSGARFPICVASGPGCSEKDLLLDLLYFGIFCSSLGKMRWLSNLLDSGLII